MSNLTRIQPQVSLIIHYTGIQQTVDYKRVLLKENPFPFHAVCNGTTWKRNVTRPEKENNFFTQERWRLQEDQQMCFTHSLLISQNTVAKVVQTFKKDGTATISQRRPGRPRKLTPRQERLLKRRVEENRHASSLQLSKEVESQTGVTISRDTIRRTLQRNGMHGCRPRKKPLLKPRHKKARLEFARAHADKDEDYWDSILWSDQDKCFWNWWLQNCMASQRWGIQRKMHGAYSETWWWQCPYVGLHECCWCRGAAFHWWHHEFTNVLLYTEREDATITPCPWSSCTFPTWQWS